MAFWDSVPFQPHYLVKKKKYLGKLYQMPTSLLQKDFGDYLQTNQIREVALPICVKDKNILPVGYAEEKGVKVPVCLPLSNRNEHALSHIGNCKQGGGKDTLASI